MADNLEEKKSKKDSPISVVLGIVLVLIVAPMIVSTAFYFLIPDFRILANSTLSGAPGPIGSFFSTIPTEEEKNNNIKQIAEYLLSVDQSQAIDKLALLKKDDEATYNRVKDVMIRLNPNVTSEMLNKIRDNSVQKDSITKMMEQMASEKDQNNQKEADLIATLTTLSAKEELTRIINSSINGYKDLSGVVAKMDPQFAATMMPLLSSDEVNKVLSLMPLESANKLKASMSSYSSRLNIINNAADIYSAQAAGQLVDEIGNVKKYKLTELPIIYQRIGVKKAGQVLAKVTDSKFVFGLLDSVKENQIVTTGSDNITKDIVTAINIYKGFDDKVSKLATIYEKIDSTKVATYINELVKNSSAPKVYNLTNGESIILSDENIAAGILDRFTDKKKSDVIQNLDNYTATEVSKMLATP